MSTEFPDPSAPGPVSSGQPGQQLKAARESLGYSVEQIADQLKLHPRQVRALEEGDYAALPPAAVTRGFVRLYARAVRLDAAPLVALLPTDAAAAAADTSLQMRAHKPASFTESRYPMNGKRRGMPAGLVIGGVVVVAAAAAAVWYFGPGGGHLGASAPAASTSSEVAPPAVPPASQNSAATTPGTMTAPAASPAANADGTLNPSVPLISVPAPAAGGAAAPAGTTPAGAGTAPAGAAPAGTGAATPGTTAPAAGRGPGGAAQTAPAAAPGAVAGATPAAAPATANPPTRTAATLVTGAGAAAPNALVLHVREDSWIQVKPETGAPLLSRLVKAGSTETVDIGGPVTVTVGNPAGVDATLRGAAVALPALPGKTIARVNLK